MAEPLPIGAVLLAAGRGTRFGPSPKLLASFDGKPLVRHAAEAAREADLAALVVVLGAHAEAVRAALADLRPTFVTNPDFALGLSTSLRAGLAALPDEVDGALVLLGDMPRIGAGHLRRLGAAYLACEPRPAAIVPVQGGRRGNPVLLNHRLLAAALARLDGDRGAGPLLAGRRDVLEIPGDAATALDIDTPDVLGAAGLQKH